MTRAWRRHRRRMLLQEAVSISTTSRAAPCTTAPWRHTMRFCCLSRSVSASLTTSGAEQPSNVMDPLSPLIAAFACWYVANLAARQDWKKSTTPLAAHSAVPTSAYLTNPHPRPLPSGWRRTTTSSTTPYGSNIWRNVASSVVRAIMPTACSKCRVVVEKCRQPMPNACVRHTKEFPVVIFRFLRVCNPYLQRVLHAGHCPLLM
jgi:hypothetical protein